MIRRILGFGAGGRTRRVFIALLGLGGFSIRAAGTGGIPAMPLHSLTRADYADRVEAVWTAQIAAMLMAWPHEHRTASVEWLTDYPRPYQSAIVDDDWYYEMSAIRGFEKFGIGMTVAELGRQWLEDGCGTWGSSKEARLNLERGIPAPDCGHPRHNKLWFTIGPQFSADVYGALAPGLVNVAARMAREYGAINGYAEAVDGAVFVAGMISLGFVERDPRTIVRQAARLIHPDSPYRKCLDEVIACADAGDEFQDIANRVEDRWHLEYPATNNAVSNGGLVALCVWFGGGDFLKTVNLAARAGDFTDADCNAANAAAVVGAMQGMKAIPVHLVRQLGDRIVGEKMDRLVFPRPVDEPISALARRTAAIGEQIVAARGGRLAADRLELPATEPETLPVQRFTLAELTRFWNPEWTLERAGFGGQGGGLGGIRGMTHLRGDVLATYPRDEVRGVLLRRTAVLGERPVLRFQAGVDAGRAWELAIFVNNRQMVKRVIDGLGANGIRWEAIDVDLKEYAGQSVELRLYQLVLVHNRTAGNAFWKDLRIEDPTTAGRAPVPGAAAGAGSAVTAGD